MRSSKTLWAALALALFAALPAHAVVLTGEVRAIDAQQILTPQSNTQPVVIRYYVPEGERVKKGEVVLRIDPGQSASRIPELELQMLPLGSRPAKRKVSGGIESLRAIPWVFAWTQIRLMLPAWLGTGAAINQVLDQGQKAVLEEMLHEWPYFQTLIDMLEMVLSKSDSHVALYYESHLTQDEDLKALGEELRQRLRDAVQTLLALKGESKLLSSNDVLDQSMKVRKPYLLPLHLLQAELMKRRRAYLAERQAENTPVDHALMVSIAGIAAGLRNTG